ncbi:hypothetical protein [Psychromonas aquimarina]|uniref:hypothetical protein n=1 Tax=Psychromonas aquimarina TaxID=444919 RepID=UPI000419204A|nr:hypothetical protein [Psychromonas aquimarina]
MKEKMISTISWLIVLWTSKVFLLSLPYKFTLHPDTQHIFGTIGQWMNGILGDAAGTWFSSYGSYVVGAFELITALILLSPVLFWMLTKIRIIAGAPSQSMMHAVGGLMASGVMAGAVFFHLFTPLGIEVIHEGQSDHGSLFYAAVSILIFGFLLFVINYMQLQSVKLKEE